MPPLYESQAGRAPARGITRFLLSWRVTFAGAELLLLLTAVFVEALAFPRILQAFPTLSAPMYAGGVVAVTAGAYVAMRWLLAAAYRHSARRGAMVGPLVPDAERLMDDRDRGRVPRAVIVAVAILLPYALVGEPTLWIVASVLAAGLIFLAECQNQIHAAESFSRHGHANALPQLRAFARAQGVRHASIFVAGRKDDPHQRPTASTLPSQTGATFCLSRKLVELLTPEELEAMFAHEVAHHRLNHPRKALWMLMASRLACVAALCVPLLWVPHGPEAPWAAARLAPALLLGWFLLRTIASGVENALLRHQERSAHRMALKMTAVPPYVSAVRKLAAHNQIVHEPGLIEKWLLNTCPSPGEVIALARKAGAEVDLPLEV